MNNKIYIVVEECSYEYSDAYTTILVTEDKETAVSWTKEQKLLVGNALSVKYVVYERDLNVPLWFNPDSVIFERSNEDV